MVVDAEHGVVDSPLHPSQVSLLPGAVEAVARLTEAGYGIAIVTNQPAAAKGKTTQDNLEAVHARVLEEVSAGGGRISSSHICFHRAEDGCDCRKPAVGLLRAAFEAHPDRPREGAWMVGDGVTDVQAGRLLGLRTAFIGKPCGTLLSCFDETSGLPDIVVPDLLGFTCNLLDEVQARPTYTRMVLDESAALVRGLDADAIEALVAEMAALRARGGRLFVLGVGGSAAHASHATADFRKMCGIEAYAPTDNVAELTARTNDEGWSTTFSAWLEVSRLGANDTLLIFSVGGGDADRAISPNLVAAIDLAVVRGATVLGVVGRDGGYTARHARVCVIVPPRFEARVTVHTEAIAAVVWHLVVSHPLLHRTSFKWESERAGERPQPPLSDA